MLQFIFGLFVSFIYSFLFLPKEDGSNPTINPTCFPIMWNGMVMIPFSSTKAIHIHHWVLYFSICIISLFLYIPKMIIGFSFGLFLQGIWYKDFNVFICDNPY
jgi:hypothetical protein